MFRFAVTIFVSAFLQRVSIVSGSAPDRSVHSAVVWRRPVDLDKLYAVLSDSAARRISLCAPDQCQTSAPDSGGDSSQSPCGIAAVSSHCTGRFVEANGQSDTIAADTAVTAGNGGWSIFHAVIDRAADAKMVQLCVAGKIAISPLRVVEYRLTPGVAELSVCL